MGGAGKSSVIHEWLQRMDKDHWRGAERVYGWSFYRQGTSEGASSDEFFDDAFQWFGEPNPPTAPWEKGRRLAELVQKERTLLILDGIEPLQEKPQGPEAKIQDTALKSLIRFLVSANSGLCVLTTRIHVADLKPKAQTIACARDLTRLSEEAGADLLQARGANGSKDELHAAVRDYHGHALALTLLGTYAHEALEGQIARRHGLPSFDGEPAQRMMALYEQWFKGKPELSILRLLGLFDQPAPKDEIDELRQDPPIAGLTEDLVRTRMFDPAWNKAVTRLRDVGLVAPKNADGAIDVHPLVREYFGKRLRDERREAFREGHRRLYEFLQKKAPMFPETLKEMEPLYKAVVHGCLAGKHQEAFDVVLLRRIRRGDTAFSINKLAAVCNEVAMLSAFFEQPWDRFSPGLGTQTRAIILNNAGFLLRSLGRLAEAARLLKMSATVDVAEKNFDGASMSTASLSQLLQTSGDLGQSLKAAHHSVALADKSNDSELRISSIITVATAEHALGHWDKAAIMFAQAEQKQRRLQPEYPLLYSVQGFRYCDFMLDLCRAPEVLDRSGRTLSWLLRADIDILSIALDHLSIGRALLAGLHRGSSGDHHEAMSHTQQALEALRRAGNQGYIPLGLLARAELHIYTGAFADARIDLDEAMDIAIHCGFRLHECDAHLGYARLAIEQKHRTDAAVHLIEARKIINETEYHRRDRDVNEIETALAQLDSSPSGDTNNG